MQANSRKYLIIFALRVMFSPSLYACTLTFTLIYGLDSTKHPIGATQPIQLSSRAISLAEYGDLESVIADGSKTTPVYKYKRSNDSSIFAIKQYPAPHGANIHGDYVQDILNEYNLGQALNHPNIAQTVYLIPANDYWSLVLEYCHQTMAQIVMGRDDPFSAYEALQIFRQLVDALSFMHGQGIAHNDLKLSNVMVGMDRQVKLIDFGTAYRFRDTLSGQVLRRRGMVLPVSCAVCNR